MPVMQPVREQADKRKQVAIPTVKRKRWFIVLVRSINIVPPTVTCVPLELLPMIPLELLPMNRSCRDELIIFNLFNHQFTQAKSDDIDNPDRANHWRRISLQ